MRKFVLGFVCGIIATVVVFFSITYLHMNNTNRPPEEMIGFVKIENGENIPCRKVRIFQVLKHNAALAYLSSKQDGYDFDQKLVLFIGDDKENFYDDQSISVPWGKNIKRVGTYTYTTKQDTQKTVPAVRLK